MFRLNSIKFHNFRNILDSEINLNTKELSTPLGGAIAGIYGTNGSSKSSVGYALCYLYKQAFDLSPAFFHNFDNDFGISDDYVSLEYDFSFAHEDHEGLIIRFVWKKNSETKKVYICEESITFKTNKKGKPYSYTVSKTDNSLEYLIPDNDAKRLCDFFSVDEKMLYRLYSTSVDGSYSMLLNLKSLQAIIAYLQERKPADFELNNNFSYLSFFAHSLFSSTAFIMPDSYGASITNNLFLSYGDKETPLSALNKDQTGTIFATEQQLKAIESIVATSNKFMKKVVSDFEVTIDKELQETTADGIKKYRVQFMSNKKEGSFLFENESEGIKRLFNIAVSLARCMNEPDFIAFIDEFDEGVFEVLYGELINGLNKQCMGQLIFTSHNLRPLEVLNYKNFIFSTLNPKNRFVTLKGVKPQNNLRDIYIRKIMYGGNDELSSSIDDDDIIEGLIDAK